MHHLEARAAVQLSALLSERATEPCGSGLTADQAIAQLEAALAASLAAPEAEPLQPAEVAFGACLCACGPFLSFVCFLCASAL